jgi:hypothetical protein
MHVTLLVIRLVLAAVFLVAGGAKLADLAGSRAAVEGFGVPAPAARVLGLLLPVAELCTAGALLPASSARSGAIAAGALLLAFVGAIGRSMALACKPVGVGGGGPEAAGFGELHVSRGSGRRDVLSCWRDAGTTSPTFAQQPPRIGACAAGWLVGARLAGWSVRAGAIRPCC